MTVIAKTNANDERKQISNALTTIEGNVSSFIWTMEIATVAETDYTFTTDAPFPGTVDTLRTKTASGTCTVTGKVNTTALGGTANSASSTASEQAHTSSNTFAKGDTVQITVTSNSSALTMTVTAYGTRTDL